MFGAPVSPLRLAPPAIFPVTDPVREQLQDALGATYDIQRQIGAGGMAVVYLAHDRKHGRDVALKVLKPELGAVLGADRFLAEIRVTAHLQHPNLLPLFDSGEAAGLLYYVMPYIEGETLRGRLAREQQLPLDETIRLVGLTALLTTATVVDAARVRPQAPTTREKPSYEAAMGTSLRIALASSGLATGRPSSPASLTSRETSCAFDSARTPRL